MARRESADNKTQKSFKYYKCFSNSDQEFCQWLELKTHFNIGKHSEKCYSAHVLYDIMLSLSTNCNVHMWNL